MPVQIIEQFIAAINAHNLDRLSALMTDDHIFIDAHNNKVIGKDNMLAGWKSYFDLFPDYHLEAGEVFVNGHEIAAFGFAEGTYKNLKGDAEKAHWKLPAAWKATLRNNQVALWQVYADTMIPSQIISRYSPPAGEADKVNGLGGVFIKSADHKALCKWYNEHLGTAFGDYDFMQYKWRQHDNKEHFGSTTFAIFPKDTGYTKPSESPFMLNFRVNNLEALLTRLRSEGVHVFEKTESYDYGKFGWIMDPDGNKVELWEPADED